MKKLFILAISSLVFFSCNTATEKTTEKAEENPKEETILKKWLILFHGTPFLGFMIPLANVLIPLFIWIHKRDDNKIYYNHGVKIINFQIWS